MLKGKSKLEGQDVVKDRGIASKRIHIERIIGLYNFKERASAEQRNFGLKSYFHLFFHTQL